MRDKPHPNHRLEWPGGIVPEWARPQSQKRRREKGARGSAPAGKRERLQKVMAQSGHGSRRNIEILIAQGHLTINGQVAKLGDSVGPGDKVKLDGELIRLRFGETLPRVLLYHKPEGEIVTRDDPEGRATVFTKLPRVNGGRWVSVGRLDINTGGLLIFTTSGELANRLMHPRFEVEREYAVRLLGGLTEEQQQKLTTGIDIEGETCKFDSIEDRGGEGANHWYHVVLREGKNREVRKMCEAVGLTVSRLMRVRYGPIEMPAFLKRGMMKEMEEADIQELMQFAGMNEPPEAPAAAAAGGEEEDERDNFGNRMDYHANREPNAAREVDGNRENVGNRAEASPREADGNRGSLPAANPPPGPRGPKQGRGPRRFGSKKRGQGAQGQGAQGQGGQGQGGHGQGGQGQQRKQGHANPSPGNVDPAWTGGEGQRPPQQGRTNTNANANANAGGKPGRNRRNKNRHRGRGGAGEPRGDAQPGANGNREP